MTTKTNCKTYNLYVYIKQKNNYKLKNTNKQQIKQNNTNNNTSNDTTPYKKEAPIPIFVKMIRLLYHHQNKDYIFYSLLFQIFLITYFGYLRSSNI